MPRKSGRDEKKEDAVINFSEIRAKKMEEKRRKTERIFFKQTLGIYCVTGNEEKRAMDLVDVSEHGLSFQVPFSSEDSWPADLEEINIRLYFSQDTYLPLRLQIQNSRPRIEEGIRYIIYGCKIEEGVKSFEAYRQFVKFLHSYAEHAHQDTGKVTHFYL